MCAVLITYGENDQLLGVPLADSSTGEEQALAVYECLQEWGLTNCVKAMCFDTTASNTGRLNGACTILEQMLDKELLYFACRHHILEVVLRGVFEVKLGSTTGPHPDLFKKIEKAWPNIDKTKYDMGISNKNVEKHITSQFITEITADFKSKLTEFQPRDDYKELLELVLVFFGTLDGREVGFKTPGAITHARWMAKAIYCLKIYLFRGHQTVYNVNVWCGLLGNRLLGPYFYENILDGEGYLDFLQNELPIMLENIPLDVRRDMIFQHDGCPAHGTNRVKRHVQQMFRLIIALRGGTIPWPPRSPDLTPLDYFLWGYSKDLVYNNQAPIESVDEVKRSVRAACATLTPDVISAALNKDWVRRAEICFEQGGGRFEHLF
ncbi:hypothetical protein WDU94_010811 [Cyamophila willieti]